MSIKKIFEFTVDKEVIVDEEKIDKDAEGNETKTITKVKKLQPQSFYVKKPNRTLRDQAELHYNVVFSEAVRAGLLTYPLLEKRYNNDGGPFSESQKQKYVKSYTTLYEKQEKYQRLQIKTEKTEEDKEESKKLLEELIEIQRDLRLFELETQALFNSTAENRAKKQTIIWYLLFLSFTGDNKPFFGEGDEKARLEKHDEMEESDDEFLLKVRRRFFYLISLWFDNNSLSQEDVKALLTSLEEDEKASKPTPLV